MNRDLDTLRFGLEVVELLLARREFGLARAYLRDCRRMERRITRLREGSGGQARRLRSL